MKRLLVVLGRTSYRHPVATLVVALGLCALSLGLARQRLTLETDWLVLFSPDYPEIRQLQAWRDKLPRPKDLAVIVSGGHLTERQEAVDRLGETLVQKAQHLEDPLFSLPANRFLESGLYYLPKAQLRHIRDDARALVDGAGPQSSTDLSLDTLTADLLQNNPGADLVIRFLRSLERSTRLDTPDLDLDGTFPEIAPESEKIRELLQSYNQSPSERLYLSLDGGETLLVLVSPQGRPQGRPEEAFEPAVAEIREILTEARASYPQLTFHLTGEPVLLVDERHTISEDALLSTTVSLILVVLLFHFGYREVTRPMLALVTLLIGLTWTMGSVALTVGHLNFISVTYVPILVGIGIDFGIHVSFRYFECRTEQSGDQAITTTMETAGVYTLIAAVTNCIPFGILVGIGFRGVAELGLIAILGVMLCQLAACSVLPALLGLLERRHYRLPPRGRQDLEGLFCALQPWGGAILSLAAITSLLACLAVSRTRFDIHLLKMQNPALESVQTELDLVATGKSSVLTALLPAANLEQARQMEEELRQLPTVAEVIALSTFLPRVEPDEEQEVERILNARPALLRLLDGIAELPSLDANRALRLFSSLEDIPSKLQHRGELLHLSSTLEARLQRRGPGPMIDTANQLMEEMEKRSQEIIQLLSLQKPAPLSQKDLPPALVSRLQAKDGTYILRVFPRQDIWRAENLHRFLAELRQVHPEVSGEPVLIELFERVVLHTHRWGIILSLVAMSAVLWGVLRSPRLALLAGLPTALSLVQVLGLMGFTDMTFNPANFVAIPMLLGIGSVFGLQSVLRMKELGDSRLLCCSTGLAILLSAATSAAGFVSLGLAAHRGIASLGGLVTLGLVVNAVLSLVVLPLLVCRFPSLLGEESTP